MDPTFVISSVAVFTGVILLLVILLQVISAKLSPGGTVKISINNGSKVVEVAPGDNLLGALSGEKIFLPSACGGGGTCAMCKCSVESGGGDILPTETGHIKKKEAAEGVRLACQVKVKEDMEITVPDEVTLTAVLVHGGSDDGRRFGAVFAIARHADTGHAHAWRPATRVAVCDWILVASGAVVRLFAPRGSCARVGAFFALSDLVGGAFWFD